MSLPPARRLRNDDPMNETTDNDADDLLPANTSSFDIQGMMSPPPALQRMNVCLNDINFLYHIQYVSFVACN